MLLGWSDPFKGILVIPGKSTKLKSGHEHEKILKIIGSLIIPFLIPASLSVKSLIFCLTSSKSKYYLSLSSSNIA